jgi:hypothetical protein
MNKETGKIYFKRLIRLVYRYAFNLPELVGVRWDYPR